MKSILIMLSQAMSAAFTTCGYDGALGIVTSSNRWDLCQFQCNGALAAAKRYKQPPMVIAEAVADCFLCGEAVDKIEAAPPGFLNITLRDAYWLRLAGALAEDETCGIPQAVKPETVLLDYGNPNVAKPLHVGHLRSAVIGEALKRLVLATGRTAIGDVHLGDWGTPMGLVLAGIIRRYTELPPITADLLNEIYPWASKKSKEDPVFLAEAREITARLQQGDSKYTAMWRELVRISVAEMKHTFARLGVRFDHWYGESDADPYIPALMARLKEKGLLRESDGAQVVDVQEAADTAPVPPVIIKKSDQSSIYATTDLAAILQREEKFHPDQVWYVVDHRQSLHFKQVFRCARRAELLPKETVLAHIGFGTMNGKDGKPFKTRDGGVMQLSVLLDEAANAALSRMGAVPGEQPEKAAAAEKIAVAAVKFGDLINHYAKDVPFDLDKFLSAEGKTGVYLLYTLTRIASILRRAEDESKTGIFRIYTNTERELLVKLVFSGSVIEKAFEERTPNLVCENAYQIAAAFSRFYHESHILGEADPEKKSARLSLCSLTGKLLSKHLDILGIEPVAFM